MEKQDNSVIIRCLIKIAETDFQPSSVLYTVVVLKYFIPMSSSIHDCFV